MQGNAEQVEWYLARNGQRYGPLSEVEFRKFIELGHLKPTDLLWREGFAEWRPSSLVFPPRPANGPPQGAPGMRPSPAEHRPAPSQGVGPGARPVGGSIGAPGAGPMAGSAAGPVASPVVGANDPRRLAAQRPLPQPNREAPQQRRPRPAVEPANPEAANQRPAARRPQPSDNGMEPARSPGKLRRILVAAVLLVTVGAGVWLVLTKRDQLMAMAGFGQVQATRAAAVTQPVRSTPAAAAPTPTKAAAIAAAPEIRFSGTEAEIDTEMQRAQVWRLLRSEFPDWYAKRVQDAGKLKAEKKDDKALLKAQLESMVALRREYQADALGSSLPRLRAIASTFLGNVTHLRKVSADACFGYISQGETYPMVVELMHASDHSAVLINQLTSVFEAVAEGRKTPRAYPAPRASDFDVLAQELTSRGWKEADMQLFADPKALSKQRPERVCQMLQDWFTAQLAVKDPEVQLRLLVDALRPVVAG